MMNVFTGFSVSTGLKENPNKCKIYFGGVDNSTNEDIKNLTSFKELSLPFKYLGVPLTSKRLFIHHYMNLADTIIGRIKHWSTKLLSYVGRIQLIKSVTFAISNYWMQCFPFLKHVIQIIESICRSFMWNGSAEISRKTPIVWSGRMCADLRTKVG